MFPSMTINERIVSCRPTWRDKWRDVVEFAPGWSRIPGPATGNLTSGGGESWRRYAPAWLFRPSRLYGNGIPDGALTKKARCLSTASFLLTRDSVGIRESTLKSIEIRQITEAFECV